MKIKFKIDYRIFLLVLMLVIGGVIVRPIIYIALLITLMLVLFSNEYETILLLFFLFPFATIFKLSAGSGSLFTYIELLVVCKFLFTKKISKSVFLGWIFYSLYIVLGTGNAITDCVKQMILPLLIYYILKYSEKDNLRIYSDYYIVSMILSSTLGYFQKYISNLSIFINTKQDHLGQGEYITRFSGLWGDPNYYTVNLILCLTIIIYFLSKKIYSTKKAVIFSAPLIIFGALTGSKSFLLMLAVVLVWMIISLVKQKRYILASISIVGIVVFAVLLMRGNISIFDNVLIRLNETKGNITTGRTSLWGKYIIYFMEHPFKLFIGNGLGKGYTFSAPHSIYIDYLDFYGILGTSIFLVCIYNCLKKYEKRFIFINYMPLIAVLILYANLSMIRYLDYGFQISLALAFICNRKEQNIYGK